MFERLGRFVSTYPRYILGFWLLTLLFCLPLAARITEVLSNDPGAAPGSVASEVASTLNREFANQDQFQLLLVAESRDVGLGNGDAAFEARFSTVVDSLRDLRYVEAITDYRNDSPIPLRSEDGRSSLAIIRLNAPDSTAARETTEAIAELLPARGPLHFYLSGGPAIERELFDISERDTRRAELFGLPISLVILALAFGAVVAAGLPLLVAVFTITLSLAALYGLGQFLPFASFVQSFVTMLGLATGIDYSLLMVNRFREELAQGLSARQAAARTTATAGRAACFSGLTVMIALAALLIPPLQFVQSMGLGSMVVMLIAVSVAITALPATLALLGKRVNWLKLTRREPGQRSRAFWRARAERIMRRPLLWIALGIVAMLALTTPALNMRVAFSGIEGLTADTSARRAQALLSEAGLGGLLRSFDVMVDLGEQGFYHPSSVRRISQLTRESQQLAGVEQTYSPTTAGGFPSLLLQQYYASADIAKRSPLRDLVSATVSENGRYALVRVFPTVITSQESHQLARSLRALTDRLELNARVGGGFVGESEWAAALYQSFPLAVGVVYLVTFVVLGFAFGSILIPIKTILLNTFTVGAAYGAITLVFQEGFLANLFGLPRGLGFVETSVPILIFALVFGLSIDYEVFVVSRIYEGHLNGLSNREAVANAIATTGNVISSAMLINFTVFSLFMFSSVVLVKTLSVGLTIAVLLDASIVRLTMVPAFMSVAGRWNWWLPRPMARWVRRVNLGHD